MKSVDGVSWIKEGARNGRYVMRSTDQSSIKAYSKENRPNYRTNASKPVLQSIDSSNQTSQTDLFEPIDEDLPEKECEEIVLHSFD